MITTATSKSKSNILCATFALTLLTVGCDSPLLEISGHYKGFFVERKASHVTQTTVSAKAKRSANDRISIEITTQDGHADGPWSIAIKIENKDKLLISAPELLDRPETIPRSSEDCFVSKRITFCQAGREISIDFAGDEKAPAVSFILDRGSLGQKPTFENPKDYTIADLLDRALTRSFESRIEFEHVVQAKLSAKNSWLNLLPHLSINSITAIAMRDVASLIGAIGDLVPFLLPTRWLQAKEADHRAAAERDAYVIMRADAANIVEGIGLAVRRDVAISEALEKNYAQVKIIRDEIHAREKLGQFLPGTSDDTTALLNQLDQDRLTLDASLKNGLAALAQASGFINPNAIARLETSVGIDIERPEPVDEDAVYDNAYWRSIELRQLDSLIEAAKLNKTQRYLSWTDPSGDYTGGLGVNLLAYVPIGESQVREAKSRYEWMEGTIAQKVRQALADRKFSIDSYALAKDSIDIQKRRVGRIIQQMRVGQSFDPIGLALSLQDLVRSNLAKIFAESAYCMAISRLNRMLYAGPYAKIEYDRPRSHVTGGVRILTQPK